MLQRTLLAKWQILFSFLVFSGVTSQAARIEKIAVATETKNDTATSDSLNIQTITDKSDPAFNLLIRAHLLTKAAENGKFKALPLKEVTDTAKDFEIAVTVDAPVFAEELFVERAHKVTIPFDQIAIPEGETSVFYTVALTDGEGNWLHTLATERETIRKDAGRIQVNRQVLELPVPKSFEEQAKNVALASANMPNDLSGLTPGNALAPPPAENTQHVYFATNRKLEPAKSANGRGPGLRFRYTFYPETRAPGVVGLTYGECLIELPSRAKEQEWFSSEIAHIDETHLHEEEAFLRAVSNSHKNDVMLFVHGFANSFEDAILQAGRVKRDTEFKGNVMVFSWPSKGSPTLPAYLADQVQNEKSIDALRHVLGKVIDRVEDQNGKLYILAHSMGNRVLIFALRDLYKERKHRLKADDKPISSIAFAAPDVDATLFSSVIPNVAKMADVMSFYYTENDKALFLAHELIGIDRAGLRPIFNDDMASIDVSSVARGWFTLGHSWYSSSDPAVLDLRKQFAYHLPPDKRKPPLLKDVVGSKKFHFDNWLLKN